jgi:hypothetical protein
MFSKSASMLASQKSSDTELETLESDMAQS